MKNQYLKNLSKLEFVVTNACTGRCKHCSEGERVGACERIDASACADAVRRIAAVYDIKTVMTFGGEPLLFVEAVEAIMLAAREMRVPRRQLITNGFFSSDRETVDSVARRLRACGVNDLLLSVDAFHQETIPLDVVRIFACEVQKNGIPMRLQPAWLVSESDENPYNVKTREILDSLADMHIPVGEGNVVFPEGNAKKYLAEYFSETPPKNPYVEDACDLRCLSFSANGDVLDGNVCTRDIMEIINHYCPQ